MGKTVFLRASDLNTILCLTVREENPSAEARAAKIRDVKPHISIDDARKAVGQIDRWRELITQR